MNKIYALREYQKDIYLNARSAIAKNRSILIQSATGSGKCFAKNTEILLYDGSVKKVQDIKVNDLLMGDDSTSRKVISVCSGSEMLYKVIPKKGNEYIVNESHILSLKRTRRSKNDKLAGKIVNISIENYLSQNNNFKHIHKGYRRGVEFDKKYCNLGLPFDPYFLGIWLGNGSSEGPAITTMDNEIIQYLYSFSKIINYTIRIKKAGGKSKTYFITHSTKKKKNIITENLKKIDVLNNKHIPHQFLISSENDRLQLLAGLLDTDGSLGNNYYEYSTKLKILNNNILFLCRSLGFAAYSSKKIIKGKIYYRVTISGDINKIPCKIKRKIARERRQKKDVLVTGIEVKKYKHGNYYGFELEGPNKLFLLSDFTVVHNTPIMAEMCDSVLGKKKRAWIIVPRRELLRQASETLLKWGVPHGMIAANMQESKSFRIHIVSKDTLIRRYDKIKNWPDLLIIDEAHLFFDRQKEIISHLPESSKIIGFTATPERTDGRGLSEVYDELTEGPSIPWLTERNFLSQIKYYAPPLEGLENLSIRGTEIDEEQLEDLLNRKKIYGELVGHYEKHGNGKPALIFCRSVKSAYQTAERFQEKGFNFHTVEGKMSAKKLKTLLNAHRQGQIDGLTTCDLVLYGVDIPRIEYGASMRPTISFSLFMQMIGRLTRPFVDKETGYKKESAIWMDHVNMIQQHGIEVETQNGIEIIPPHYVDHIPWNFHGDTKRKRKKKPRDIKLCPHQEFFYCSNPKCSTCPHNPDKTVKDARKSTILVNTDLDEIKKPVALKDRPENEKREFQDRIGEQILIYKENKNMSAVAELLKIAEELGYGVLWVYWKLTSDERKTINIPLLHEIARIKKYKPGWAYFQMQKIKTHKAKKQEYRRVMN